MKLSLKKGRCRLCWVSQLMLPNRREWDEQVLKTCMYPHDVEAVLRIRLSERMEEDFVAWFYEKSGIFTVKSAYQLAASIELASGRPRREEGTSSREDGCRNLYNEIWLAKVPQKVRIFAWKLSQEGLATQENRKRRTLAKEARCTICGREDESGYHAVLRCTKARALRLELRKQWVLPDESKLRYTGPEWLLVLLSQLNEGLKAKLLLMLWRAWYLRNDSVHGEGAGSITGSAHFLVSYWESLQSANQNYQVQTSVKGKEVVGYNVFRAPQAHEPDEAALGKKEVWKPPPEGWVTINTGAGFCKQSGIAGTGIVVRDQAGRVLLTAWRFIRYCGSPEACLQGVRLAAEWVRLPARVESDCLALIKAVDASPSSRSAWAGIVDEIRAARNLLPECTMNHIRREANKVAHGLAQRAMSRRECVVMRHAAPDCVRNQLDVEAVQGVDCPSKL
jgi:hypothetical protein